MCTNMKELSDIADQLYELEQKKAKKKKEMDELDAKIKVLKDETVSYMKKRQKDKLQAGLFIVVYTPYTRPQFNKDAFIKNEEKGQELYDKYCKIIPIQKVTVKLVNE